jgi:hypothetical protein
MCCSHECGFCNLEDTEKVNCPRVGCISNSDATSFKKCRRPVKNGPTNRRPVVESDVLVFRAENVPLEQLTADKNAKCFVLSALRQEVSKIRRTELDCQRIT